MFPAPRTLSICLLGRFSLLFWLGLVSLATADTGGASKPASQALGTAIEGLLFEATDSGALPGVIAGVATRDDTVYIGSAGQRDVETSAPMNADTLIAIASMTKPVTTVAVLQLVERGLVDLDAPFSEYLPQLERLQIIDARDESGAWVLRDAPTVPTVRQLLTHTSGYVYEIWNENIFDAVQGGQIPSLFVSEDGLNAPLAFPPGERWEYGIGIDWAGIVVEQISGLALDAYFDEHIFGPLQMGSSGFFVADNQSDRAATIYARTPEGFAPLPRPAPSELGGGGLYSTVGDYLRFLRALLNGGALDGRRVLKPETVDAMFRNQIGDLRVSPGESQMPPISTDFDMGFGAPASWGLGFLRHEAATAEGRPAGSVSWAGLYNSYFWIDPENGLCAVVATQVLPFFDQRTVDLLKDIELEVYNHKP